jgi:hypothetical protein
MKTEWDNLLNDLWVFSVDGKYYGAVSVNTLSNKFILLDLRNHPDCKLMSVVEYTFVEDAKMALEEHFEVYFREMFKLRKEV